MYKIEFVKVARKIYERLPKDVRKTIRHKLMKLAEDPFKPYNEVTPL